MKKKEFITKAHPDRKKRIADIQANYVSSKMEDGIINIHFLTETRSNQNRYNQTLQIMNTPEKINKTTITKGIKSDLKVHCECADYLYKGFKYIGTENDYAIEPESLEPVVTNPMLEGTVCKHLLAVLNTLDRYIPNIVKDLNEH